ncbi:MAG: fibronectin type III domain-containing protein [Gemmatimonadota bacterium]|jgi:hypothetical protein
MKWTRTLALVAAVLIGSLGIVACSEDDPVFPGAPGSVTLTVNGQTIVVSWTAASDADTYLVTLTTSGEAARTETATSNTTEATFTGLTRGKTYCAVVTAGNGEGDASSDPECAEIAAPQPGAPTSVEAQASTDEVTVTWTPGPNATGHRVELREGATLVDSETLGASASSHTFTGLDPATTFLVQVFALNDQGEIGSTAVTVTTQSSVVEVTDDIDANTTWTSDRVYLLTQPIFVGTDCGADGMDPDCNSVTLTIEPGTTILGQTDLPQGIRGAYLVVSRGSRIIADANANRADKSARPDPDDVIVFTSSAPAGQRARGDWGGLVINGRAPTNAGAEAEGEGDSGLFGGTDEMDDSGIIRGVRIEFAGDDVTPTDQLNGLAPQGVGAGTIIDYVQIHYNVDDGIEPFGGTATATHIVVTGIGDDSFDGTDGFRGFWQFLLGQQRADDADQGFELSNNGDTPAATPRSMAVVANATVIGARENMGSGEISALGGESDHGILLREGSNWKIYNSIVTGFGRSACVEGAQTITNATARQGGSADPATTTTVEGSIFYGNTEPNSTSPADNFAASCDWAGNQAFFTNGAFNNMLADPNLPDDAFSVGTQGSPPNVIPTAMPGGYAPVSVANMITGGLVMPADGRTLQDTDYAGAVEPGTALEDAWYFGWTVWATDGSDSRPGLDDIN